MASDKSHGILGKAELDLSVFGDEDFHSVTLDLIDCKYEGAQISVGLKGVPNVARNSPNRSS